MPLTLFNSFVYPDFIGDSTAACSYCSADESAFSSTKECSCNRAACCGAANDLRSGVVLMVMGSLCAFGALVAALSGCRRLCNTREGERQETDESE